MSTSKRYYTIFLIVLGLGCSAFFYYDLYKSPENVVKRSLVAKYPTMTKFQMAPLSDKGVQSIFQTKFLSSLMTAMLVKDSTKIESIRSEMKAFDQYVKEDCYIAIFYHGKDGKTPAAFFVSKDLTKYNPIKIID